MRCAQAVSILSLVILGCAGSEAATRTAGDRPLAVQRGDFAADVLLTGELVAEDAVKLVTPNVNIWPVPIRWLAEDGAEVRAGDPVVEFDNSQLAGNLEELRVGVLQAINELASTRARIAAELAETVYAVEQATAELEKARLKAEVPPEVLTGIEYEERQLAWKRAELELAQKEQALETRREAGRAEIEIARIALEKTRRSLRRAEDGIALLSLRAPRNGIVLRDDNRREGRPFQAGDTTYPGRPVARLPDLETMIVEARLFDVDDGLVAPGQRAWLTLDAYPEDLLGGTVRVVESLANETSRHSRRRAFRVLIDLDAVDAERMRPGMSVKVTVAGDPRADVLLVPRPSIDWRTRPPRVALAGGGWATPELGPCNPRVCVALSGLDEGARLRPAAEGAS